VDQPPAAMPTEEWVRDQHHHHKLHRKKDQDGTRQQQEQELNNNNFYNDDSNHDKNGGAYYGGGGSSFLAPVADLINFGPPCTRGWYNAETQSFEIIATCNFRKGQEVTFWYSDACDDIVVGNYGFTHPMVPPCPNLYHWQKQAQLAQAEMAGLEQALANAYYDLDIIDLELERVQRVLNDCDCCEDKDPNETNDIRDEKVEISKENHHTGGSSIKRTRSGNRYAPSPMKPRRRTNLAPSPAQHLPVTSILFTAPTESDGVDLPTSKTHGRKSDRGL
jgi:SET domain